MTAAASPAIPRTALVTGAAHRIGRAIALDLAAQGFDVAIHYNRSRDAAEELAAEIKDAGRRTALLDADLSVEGHTAALMGRAAEALGPVGCLVNNASRFDLDF